MLSSRGYDEKQTSELNSKIKRYSGIIYQNDNDDPTLNYENRNSERHQLLKTDQKIVLKNYFYYKKK